MHSLIITGGSLDLAFAKQYIKTLSYDKVFAVDRGLEYARKLNLIPDCVVGDFDTIDHNILNDFKELVNRGDILSEILEFPPMKDASDTEIAMMEALNRGASEITILGGTGSRLDHVFANFNILKLAEERNVKCYLVDANNRIQLMDATYRNECSIERDKQFGKYVSVLLMTEEIKGLSLTGFVYPVDNVDLLQGSSLTVSNEISEQVGAISLKKGRIWIIESRD